MHNDNESRGDRGVVSMRTMEIVVAVFFLVLSAIVIQDSLRVGAGWAENEGPRAGYFPFYIGLIMGISALVTLIRTVVLGMRERRTNPGDQTGRRQRDGQAGPDAAPFVGAQALRRVLLVLVPVLVYILAATTIGIYVASALFITAFMMYFGGYRSLTALAIGVVVAVALFFMFEVWFLVPLPKGPLEVMLGF